MLHLAIGIFMILEGSYFLWNLRNDRPEEADMKAFLVVVRLVSIFCLAWGLYLVGIAVGLV